MKIQVCCKQELFCRVSKGPGSLPVMAAKISVAAVRKAYCADPNGFSRLYLAKEEQEELSSFRFPQKKFPWLAARVVTKRLFCRLMRGKGEVFYPHEVAIRKISAGPGRGKPLLRVSGLARMTIFSDLSLSHAGPWALCALTNNGQVGIDIEPVEESSPLFTKTVYTSGEIEALNVLFGRMTLTERVKLLWVMKESLLKALGVGFYYGLGSVRLKGAGETGLVFTIQALDEATRDKVIAAFFSGVRRCVPETGEDVLPGYMDNIIGGRIANIYDVRGINVAIDAGTASFPAALEAGIKYLVQGECRTVLVGGVHANMTPEFLKTFELYRQQSIGLENGAGYPPSDSLPGEGTTFFVLKKLEDVKDATRVYGVITGVSIRQPSPGACRISPSAAAEETFYFGVQGAFSLLKALRSLERKRMVSVKPDLKPGPVTISSYSPAGGEYSLVVDRVQGALMETNERPADDFCSAVYLGANSWPELLAELKLLLSQLERDTELFPCTMPTLENFHYRIGLVYSSCDELKRKIRLALHLLEKEAG